MFCSRCGKTLQADQTNCPHCGAPVGDSQMGGHTSVQPRYRPGDKAGEQARYTPITKTTYTSMDDAEGDVYSRTAYRPIVTDETAKQTTTGTQSPEAEEPAPDVPEKAGEAVAKALGIDPNDPSLKLPKVAGEATPDQREKLDQLKRAPADAPKAEDAQRILKRELDIDLASDKPIRKTGISPQVEQYIQRMEAARGKTRRRVKTDDGAGDTSGEPEAEAVEQAEPRARKPRGAVGKWILRAVAALAVIGLLVGGVVYLAYKTQPRAPIEGVTVDLYDQGVALIKSHATNEYRTSIVKLFQSDVSGATALAQQQADRDAIQALLPAKPQENDQKFIDTLLKIQTSIDTATTTDALAILTSGDSSLGSLSQESEDQWGVINNALLRLDTADDLTQLKAIQDGVTEVVATPSPAPSATPSAYKTLKKNDQNNAVKRLQQRLFQLGWFNSVRDGDYGTLTQAAVKRFQQAAGLEVTGIATPEVQEAIFAEDAPRTGERVTPAPDIDSVLNTGGDDNDVTDQALAK